MMHFLSTLILEPLVLVFDLLFGVGSYLTGSVTAAIIILSFLATVMLIPVYRPAIRQRRWLIAAFEILFLGFALYYLARLESVRGVLTGFISRLYSYDRLGAPVLFAVVHIFTLIIFVLCNKCIDRLLQIMPGKNKEETGVSRTVFMLCNIFLAVESGIMIPTYVLRTSPAEFMMNIGYSSSFTLVVDCLLISFGLYVIWGGIFYLLSSRTTRYRLGIIASVFSIISAADYMFFGRKYGNMSVFLAYDSEPVISSGLTMINLLVVAGLTALVIFAWRWPGAVRTVCVIGVVEVIFMSSMNSYAIYAREKEEASSTDYDLNTPVLEIDKTGNNVIIIMLDRAINAFIPFLFNEDPALASMFDDFTYYPNTLSYGAYTNVGTMSLYGGYDYIPDEVNARDDVSLKDKQNEALKMLPVIFEEAGYDVTVCDPPYANYKTVPDLSIFDDHPEIHKYNMVRSSLSLTQEDIAENRSRISRNLSRYSIFREVPVVLHRYLYDKGRYNDPDSKLPSVDTEYVEESASRSYGYRDDFMAEYGVLQKLEKVTRISENGADHLIIMNNAATHFHQLLQEPEYEPRQEVDNTEFDEAHPVRYDQDGRELVMDNAYQLSHYQSNMAALRQVGKWIEYLKENGVYDNSRIIIVADHGRDLGLCRQFTKGGRYYEGNASNEMDNVDYRDIMLYNPLLMVKDFNEEGFRTDETFMTNADTPSIALKGIVNDPVNPYTGNRINEEKKNDSEQHIMYTQWNINVNNGNAFSPGVDLTLRNGDMFDIDNWTIDD